jgi:hypothetical protein
MANGEPVATRPASRPRHDPGTIVPQRRQQCSVQIRLIIDRRATVEGRAEIARARRRDQLESRLNQKLAHHKRRIRPTRRPMNEQHRRARTAPLDLDRPRAVSTASIFASLS